MLPVVAAAQQFLPDFGPPVDPNLRFEVAAKAPDGTPPSAMSVLLANLLKDRFQMAMHLETREQAIYHLVLARADRRLGPDIKPSSTECQATIAERIAAMQSASGRGGPPPLPALPGPNDPLPCGFVRSPPGLVAASGRNISEFARGMLSDLMGRPVIDKTGLAGLYDFTLKYASELGRTAGPLGLLAPGTLAPVNDPDAPSLGVALQEQLGLKLESARGPVEVVVIDRLEKPALD
jgi:uncharacterized protein (TIGR03435 family)